MAFSFTPAQVAASGMAVQGGVVPAIAPQETSPYPDSPVLYLREIGKEKSIMAYVQLFLILLSIVAVLASCMLFAYTKYLASSIEGKQTELASADVQFKEYPFQEMQRFSDRIASLSKLLDGYVSSRSPLRFLENVVEKNVLFTNFTLLKRNEGYVISVTAVTGNYRFLIQQLEALNLTQYQAVAPKPELTNLKDLSGAVEVKLSSPVFVQGKLPDEIVFVQPSFESTSVEPQNDTQVSSTTSQ
jgi:hypothetical protein